MLFFTRIVLYLLSGLILTSFTNNNKKVVVLSISSLSLIFSSITIFSAFFNYYFSFTELYSVFRQIYFCLLLKGRYTCEVFFSLSHFCPSNQRRGFLQLCYFFSTYSLATFSVFCHLLPVVIKQKKKILFFFFLRFSHLSLHIFFFSYSKIVLVLIDATQFFEASCEKSKSCALRS